MAEGRVLALDVDLLLALGGLLLGLAAGVILRRTHYCFMGAIADWVLFASRRRLRSWLLAAALAALGTQLLALSTRLALGDSAYLASPPFWIGALLGGLAFGFGMVLTGGCISRNLVRAAGGSLKAWLVVLLVAVSAYATMAGILAPLHGLLRALNAALTPDLAVEPGLVGLVAGLFPLAPQQARLLLLLLPLGVLAFVFADPHLRRPGPELLAGVGLGVLVPMGWYLTGVLAFDPFELQRPQSLAFVGPTARSLLYVMTGGGSLPAFGTALVFGVLLGAAFAARSGGFRLETFRDGGDVLRHVLGALLMGVGGTLAGGCTIGRGLTGLSTLSLDSFLATAAIFAGGVWGVRYLESGKLWPLTSARRALTAGGPAAPAPGPSSRMRSTERG